LCRLVQTMDDLCNQSRSNPGPTNSVTSAFVHLPFFRHDSWMASNFYQNGKSCMSFFVLKSKNGIDENEAWGRTHKALYENFLISNADFSIFTCTTSMKLFMLIACNVSWKWNWKLTGNRDLKFSLKLETFFKSFMNMVPDHGSALLET